MFNHQEWRDKNREKISAYNKKYRDANRDRRNKQKRDRWASDPQNLERQRAYRARPGVSKKRRETSIRRRYDLSMSDLESILASQKHCCAVCCVPIVTVQHRANTANIDHCHATGQVRGVLCNKCNRGIGLLKDDPALLRAALSYLTRTGALRLVTGR